jgi:putative PIN family toxin of toxin-antitoxin system
MKIVLDTNVLLTSISPRSKDYWIFQAFINEAFVLCMTTDVMAEYEEIIGREMGVSVANDLMQAFEFANNVELITTWYRWSLIVVDPDDNKFVDCAVASGASYLVSEDRHFKVLSDIQFPKVNVVRVDDFKRILG